MDSGPEKPAMPVRIGRYNIVERLGRGGMATVYLARKEGPGGFERFCAIKTIHEHLASAQSFVSMFLDEARIAARLHHPNIASVFDVDKDDVGRYFIAMDYVRGETLRNLTVNAWQHSDLRAFPLDVAVHLTLTAADALHAAHELCDSAGVPLNVIHRDVSPRNILVGYDGILRVVDFGVAKARNQLSATRPGTQKGTVAYMAPEQFSGIELDRRADIFSLGTVLWEMTVGKRLFKRENDFLTADKIRQGRVPRPTQIIPNFPPALEAIILKSLHPDRDARFSTARELANELRRFLVETRSSPSAVDVEALMTSLFHGRHQEKLEMERRAMRGHPRDEEVSESGAVADSLSAERSLSQDASKKASVEKQVVSARSMLANTLDEDRADRPNNSDPPAPTKAISLGRADGAERPTAQLLAEDLLIRGDSGIESQSRPDHALVKPARTWSRARWWVMFVALACVGAALFLARPWSPKTTPKTPIDPPTVTGAQAPMGSATSDDVKPLPTSETRGAKVMEVPPEPKPTPIDGPRKPTSGHGDATSLAPDEPKPRGEVSVPAPSVSPKLSNSNRPSTKLRDDSNRPRSAPKRPKKERVLIGGDDL